MVDDDDAYTSDGADVEKLVWNLAAGYECGAGPYCQDCDWNGDTGGCRMRDAIAAAGIRLTAHPETEMEN